MSWEDPQYSFNYGQPPTPTRTPTSATFPDPFQTPKQESSFYDPRVTWNTADPYAASPNILKTPQPLTFPTPNLDQSPTFANSQLPAKQNLDTDDVAPHPPELGGSQSTAESSRNSSSEPSAKKIRTASNSMSKSPGFGLALDTNVAVQSAGSMQTPPPTSTSSSKRKGQRAQLGQLAQQSTSSSRRMSVPVGSFTETEVIGSQLDNTPQQFSSVKFSPDLFAFPLAGPATAPAYPQQKLFWDPSNENGMDMDFSSTFDDPFSTNTHSILDPFVSAHHQPFAAQASVSSSFIDSFDNGSKEFSSVAITSFQQITTSTGSAPAKSRSSVSKGNAAGVNPSLLFSSPSRSSTTADGSTTRVLDEELLQPYCYQMQEARREQVSGGIKNLKRRRKPDIDSPAVAAALETLREDDAGRMSPKRIMSDGAASEARLVNRVPRLDKEKLASRRQSSFSVKSSQIALDGLGSARPKTQRPAVSLTIDASGRARTEMRTSVERSDRSPSADDPSLPSDHSDSDTSSDESAVGIIHSQASSFDFSAMDSKRGRAVRFSSITKSHSQKSSAASIFTTTSHANKGPSGGFVPSSSLDLPENRVTEIEDASEAETLRDSEGPQGTAQLELKKMLKDQGKENAIVPRSSKEKSKSRQPIFPLQSHGQASQNPQAPATTNPSFNTQNFNTISPTSLINSGNLDTVIVRCRCQSSEWRGTMIACDSCKCWLHAQCVGFSAPKVPKSHQCVFCIGQFANVGEVNFQIPSPPLQQTQRFR